MVGGGVGDACASRWPQVTRSLPRNLGASAIETYPVQLPSAADAPLPSPHLAKYWADDLPAAPAVLHPWALDCYRLANPIKQWSDMHFFALHRAGEVQPGSDFLFWYWFTQARRCCGTVPRCCSMGWCARPPGRWRSPRRLTAPCWRPVSPRRRHSGRRPVRVWSLTANGRAGAPASPAPPRTTASRSTTTMPWPRCWSNCTTPAAWSRSPLCPGSRPNFATTSGAASPGSTIWSVWGSTAAWPTTWAWARPCRSSPVWSWNATAQTRPRRPCWSPPPR